MDILTTLGKALITGALSVGAMFGVGVAQAPVVEAPSYGDFNPTGGTTYRLASSIGTTDTSIRLSSFKEPTSDIPYTMSYLGTSIGYGTLDPQNSRSEFISFTGITQNSNGTAVLTGVTRGLARSPGASATGCTVASSTLRQSHSGQSIFIMSDSPCFFSEYAVKRNNETITGLWSVPTPLSAANIATKAYVDGAAFGGIGGASETATGTVQMATGAQAAAGTTNGSIGRLALGSNLSTSTYNSATAVNVIPVTDGTGFIDGNFLPTTIPNAHIFSGNLSMSGTATSTFASSSVVSFASTSPTTTYTKPSNLKYLLVVVQGAGGKGSNDSNCGGCPGGGSGGYAFKIIPAAAVGTTETVTVAAGTSPNLTTSFGSHVSCTAGGNGTTQASAGAAGTCTGGDVNIAGSTGRFGSNDGTVLNIGGNGGDSQLGNGGNGAYNTSAGAIVGGATGQGYGGGGGGCAAATDGSPNCGTTNMAAGADGIIIVYQYFY